MVLFHPGGAGGIDFFMANEKVHGGGSCWSREPGKKHVPPAVWYSVWSSLAADLNRLGMGHPACVRELPPGRTGLDISVRRSLYCGADCFIPVRSVDCIKVSAVYCRSTPTE